MKEKKKQSVTQSAFFVVVALKNGVADDDDMIALMFGMRRCASDTADGRMKEKKGKETEGGRMKKQ